MRFFFFGTLMDPDVRRAIIGRDLSPGQVEEAVVEGFRRVHVAKRNYPMLLPHASGWVDGMLAHDIDAEAARRLMVFEGNEYHLAPIMVADLHGHLWRAAAFLPAGTVRPDHRGWHLETWQRRYKRLFLRHAGALMERYGTQAMLRVMPNGLPALSSVPSKGRRFRGRALARA
jgi:hypothetical protein